MTNNTEILRTEGLKRSYLVNETKIDVLKGINLTINNQEFIAIMGKQVLGYVHNILAVRFRLQLSFCNVFDCHGYPFPYS